MGESNMYAILKNKEVIPAINVETWAEWFETSERVVAKDIVRGYGISTVFLGIDHGFGGEPLWFETMVFEGDDARDILCDRYSTYEEAEAGHKSIVEKLKNETK